MPHVAESAGHRVGKGPLTPAILGYKCAAKMERRGWRLTPNPTRLAMSLCITARPPGGKRRGFRVCFWHLAEVDVFAGQCLLLRRSGLHLAASAPPRRSLATWTRRASSADYAPRQKTRGPFQGLLRLHLQQSVTATTAFTGICTCYYGGPPRYPNSIEGPRYADALATSDMSVKVRLSRPVERRRGVPIPYRRRVQQVGLRRQSACRIAESIGNI